MVEGRSSGRRELLEFASRVSADQTARFQAAVRALEAGDTVQFSPYASAATAGDGAEPVYLQAPYSLSALARLTRRAWHSALD